MTVFDIDAALRQALIGLPGQLFSPVLGNYEAEGALDCLNLGIGAQKFLRTPTTWQGPSGNVYAESVLLPGPSGSLVFLLPQITMVPK